jgi:hypothetical protein
MRSFGCDEPGVECGMFSRKRTLFSALGAVAHRKMEGAIKLVKRAAS